MALSDFIFIPLSESIDLGGFDCNDSDVNEFLQHDAINYFKERIASTYLFIDELGKVILFFSISNDSVKDLGAVRGYNNSVWNRLHRKTGIPNSKRIRQYPAVKIGRLGVCKEFQRSGIAYELMDFIKGWLSIDHKPAFRFLILDAYNKERQISFYMKNGFDFLLSDDGKDETRIMYFDMNRF